VRSGQVHIEIARVYDADDGSSAARLLIDRLWPRGMSRETLRLDEWIPEVAPSTALRKWFHHEHAKWDKFQERYRAELVGNPEAVERCLVWCRKVPVKLLYSARDREHNQAVVLRQHLVSAMTSGRGTG